MNPRTEIAVVVLAPQWRRALPGAPRFARRAAKAALAIAGSREGRAAELSVVLADDVTIRRLNRTYRGIDGATNVLSFSGSMSNGGVAGDIAAPQPLGDVVLACETVVREAAAQGKTIDAHLCHLVAHGVLHLLGHDHETDAAAAVMERLEVAALAGLGIADPYALPDGRVARIAG